MTNTIKGKGHQLLLRLALVSVQPVCALDLESSSAKYVVWVLNFAKYVIWVLMF